MAPTVSRGVVIEADQDEQVRALISRGLNFSDFVQAATDILLSGELAKYGGLTPGESLRRALDRASIADEAMAMLSTVVGIKEESRGVAGWHLNGEIAAWDEVLPGFEEAYASLGARGAPRER